MVEARRPKDMTLLLETTDYVRRANVLRFTPSDDPALQHMRETKWEGLVRVQGGNERDWIITAGCKCVCSVPPEGGHLGTTVHIQTDEDKEDSDETIVRI
jgi:hypothetical protein